MKKRNIALILVLAAFVLLVTIFSGCSSPNKNTSYSKSGVYFDTTIKVTVYTADDSEYLEGCMDMAEKYESLFSRTIDTSDVSRINDANGEFVEVDPETITLIQKGIEYGQLSNGGFDITIGALSDLWDISNHPTSIPEESDIETALATVDYHNIEIDGNSVRLTDPDTKLDLGGIAKGYIADQMKSYLTENGVTSGLINLGGNVVVIGSKTNGEPFAIGIQKPFDETGTAIAKVEISDQSMVSSGTYERYVEIDGKIYHHILDTETGYPVDNGLTGVTIISNESVDGDGLSTTCFSLGLEKGMELIESLDNTEAIFITEDGTIYKTSGIGTDIPFEEL